jgi:hypothetical protein
VAPPLVGGAVRGNEKKETAVERRAERRKITNMKINVENKKDLSKIIRTFKIKLF